MRLPRHAEAAFDPAIATGRAYDSSAMFSKPGMKLQNGRTQTPEEGGT